MKITKKLSWLAIFFFLAPKDFHGNFSLILFLLVKLINTCIKNRFFLGYRFFSCLAFTFFLTHLKTKTAKKFTWLAYNLSWRIFLFFEKITLKKKKQKTAK